MPSDRFSNRGDDWKLVPSIEYVYGATPPCAMALIEPSAFSKQPGSEIEKAKDKAEAEESEIDDTCSQPLPSVTVTA